MFKKFQLKSQKGILKHFIVFSMILGISGVYSLSLTPAKASVTTSTITGLTTFNQPVSPGDTLAVFGINLAGDDSETLNSITMEIMGPHDTIAALSSAAASSGVKVVKDHESLGDNGVYDTNDTAIAFESVPSWNTTSGPPIITLNIVDDAIPANDSEANAGNDYFIVVTIKAADQINYSSMFGFGLMMGNIDVTDVTNFPSSWTEASHVYIDAGLAVINEVVTDPQTDWNDTTGGNGIAFDATAGTGTVDINDEYIEIYIKKTGLDLTGWTIELNDGSNTPGSLAAGGAFTISRYVGTGGGSFTSTAKGDYLVLGNPIGEASMDDNIEIFLNNSSNEEIDRITLGTYDDGNTWDNAASGAASAAANEAVGRNAQSKDTDWDKEELVHQASSLGAANNPPPSVMFAELDSSDPMKHTVRIMFSKAVIIGSAQTVGNYTLTSQGSVHPASATWGGSNSPTLVTLVFTETITTGGGTNQDELTISGVEDDGGLSGAYTGIEIFGGDPGGPPPGSYGAEMAINEVVTNPQSDWNDTAGGGTAFDASAGTGTVDVNDEYVELMVNRDGLDLTNTGWKMKVFNDNYNSPLEGNLVAYNVSTNASGLFDVVRYVAIDASGGTVSDTKIGDYLVLGTLHGGNFSDNVRIELENSFGNFIDEVSLGDFDDGWTGDNASACGSTTGTESSGRNAVGTDTENNSTDFGLQTGTPGAANTYNPLIAIEGVFIKTPTEIGIDFTERTMDAIITDPSTYFSISPSITISGCAIENYGGGRFITLTLAQAMTDQEYTITVSKNNTIKDYGTNGADGSETITAANYSLWGFASDSTAPQISGLNIMNGNEIEVLFNEQNGVNIYGADNVSGGSGENLDAAFQFSPGLGTVTAYSMWDRIKLETTTAQTPGQAYTLTISNLRDNAQPSANILTANSFGGSTDNQTSFTGFNGSSFDDGSTPFVMDTYPMMGASNIPPNIKKIKVNFSEPMNSSSFIATATPNASTDTILLGKVNTSDWSLDAGNLVALESVSYNADTQSIEITIPTATTLSANTAYMIFVRGDNNSTQIGVSDVAGTEMTWDFFNDFWTANGADTTKPQVSNTSLDDYSGDSYTGVSISTSNISIYFSESMDPSTIFDENTADTSNNITLTYLKAGVETKVPGRIFYECMGRSADFLLNSVLDQNTQYTLKVTTGVKDSAANALNNQFTQIFTTGGADTTGPKIEFADSDGYWLWIQFNEAVQAAQATNLSNWTLVAGGSAVDLSSAQTEYFSWENGLEIRGLSLTAGQSFVITASTNIQDPAGNALQSSECNYTNTVFDSSTWNNFPMMNESYPYPWAMGIPKTITLSASFSEDLDQASITASATAAGTDTVRLYKVVNGAPATLVNGTAAYLTSSKTITFDPTSDLDEDQDYRLVIGMDCAPGQSCDMTQSIRDAGGMNIPYPFFVDFRTGAGTDSTKPTLSSSSPADSDTGVSVGGVISLFFSEALNPSTLTNTNIKLATTAQIGGGPYIPGTIDYDPMGYIADFKPSAILALNTAYTVRITTGVQDAAGNAVNSNIDFAFTTTNSADTTDPEINWSDADPFGVFIKFSEPVNQEDAENIRNYTLIGATSNQDLDNDGYPISLQGKTPEYHFMDSSVYIPNLNLTAGNKFRITVANVTDISGNSIKTTADTNSVANNRAIEGVNLNFNQFENTVFDMTFMDETVHVMNTFPNDWNAPTGISKVKIGFSEGLDRTTVSSSSILLIPMVSGQYLDANNVSDNGGVTISWEDTTNEVIISGFTLSANTEYKIKVTTAIKDGGGNYMMSWNPWDTNDDTAYESFFKTQATAGNDITKPEVWGTNLEQYRDVNGDIVGVPLWFGAIDIKFSEQMEETTIKAVDATFNSTIYITGISETRTLMANSATDAATLTVPNNTEFLADDHIKIYEDGVGTTYATILSVNTSGDPDVLTLNKNNGYVFTSAATVTKMLKGFVEYDPWDTRATFIADEPLAQNKTYTLTITTGAQDISGNGLASNQTYQFVTENSADTTAPFITYAETESFEARIWFNEPLQRTLAENVRNYTLESPIGNPVNLDGKTIEYRPMERGVFIRDLQLTGDNTFKITVSNRILDLSGTPMNTSNAEGAPRDIGDINSNGTTSYKNAWEGYVMAHFEDFFGGKEKIDFTFDDKMFDQFMNYSEVMPMNPMVNRTTNYFVNFPTTSAIPSGGKIVIKFPEGFEDLSSVAAVDPFDPTDPNTWGPDKSPVNGDINGWGTGTVTIASVSVNTSARTITITTGGAATQAFDFINLDLKGIKNPASPHDSPEYKANITTKNADGTNIEGPFDTAPIFIQQKGNNIIQGTITLPGADAGGQIIVELHGPAGMLQETLVIDDNKVNGTSGAALDEATREAKYKFSDLPPGGYDVMVMGSNYNPIITVNKDSVATEYFSPAMREMVWAEGGETKNYSLTLVDSTASSWTDDWGNEKTMQTLTVVISGGPFNSKAKVDVSGPGQFFGKEITFDGSGDASVTFSVPQEMYMVNIHPYMPMMMFTAGPPPAPDFISPPGKDVVVNGSQDGGETGTDQVAFNLTNRNSSYYLSVTVRDSINQTGINNAEVFAHNPNGFGVPPTVTDSSGVATLKLPAGVYQVGAMIPGFPPVPEKSVEITSDNDSAGSAAVLIFDVKMDLDNTYKISGIVKDSSGNLQANVPVWADERDSSDANFLYGHIPNMTNSEGAYEFRVSSGASWRIKAFIPGYGETDHLFIRSISADRTTGTDLTPKTDLATVTGTIKVNAVAVQGVHVAAEGISGTQSFNDTHTESDGTFALRLGAGTYKIMVFSPEFGEKVIVASQIITSDQATNQSTVALGDQEISSGQDARTVTLEFKDAAGDDYSPEKIFVDIRDANGNGVFKDFSDVDSGTVKIPDGTYTIDVYTPETGSLIPITSVAIDGSQNGTETAADTLPITVSGFVTISGKIYKDTNGNGSYDAGEELSSAFVSAYSEVSNFSANATTDSNGDYTLSVLQNASYKITSDKLDYVPLAPQDVAVVESNLSGTDYYYALAAKNTNLRISGLVYFGSATAANLADNVNKTARVWAETEDGRWASTDVEADGSYTLYVTAGTWKVRGAGHGGYKTTESALQTVTVVASAQTGKNIILSEISGYEVQESKGTSINSDTAGRAYNADNSVAVVADAKSMKNLDAAVDITVNIQPTTSVPEKTNKVSAAADGTASVTNPLTPIAEYANEITAEDSSGSVNTLDGEVRVQFSYADYSEANKTAIEANTDIFKCQFLNESGQWQATDVSYIDADNDLLICPTNHFSTYAPSLPTDVLAPSAPTGVSVAAGNGQATISWTKNSESDMHHYIVWETEVSEAQITTITQASCFGSSCSYTHTGCTNGTQYGYQILAVDSDGYTSAGSAAVQYATPAAAAVIGGGVPGGGSGGTTQYCKSVTYGNWQEACDDGWQYREIELKNPTNCLVTSEQKNEKKRKCAVVDETQEDQTQEIAQETTTGAGQGKAAEFAQKIIAIASEAAEIIKANVNTLLVKVKLKRNLTKEANSINKYVKILTKGQSNFTGDKAHALTNFITYGTETTKVLGEGERAGVVNSYKAAFGKLPQTEEEWNDVIKIGNGRWPSERNTESEANAATAFKKIYLKEPDRDNSNDDAAVTVIAYGLRPSDRNLDSEKAAIKIFKAIYKYNPESATAWDIVRAIAYSGATR